MDILNYISWVKENKIITTISDLNTTLIPIGLKDSRRDDDYLSVGISVASLAAIIGGGSGTGTVTSVGAIGGTGISITGTNPITTSGTFTITNTAPDQTVVLTNGTGITTSGTYPNFTITNSAPDQTVSLTDGTGISVTGTYPSFTITNTQPSSGGTVTSVGLTMPSAFTVANSPVTGSATLNVTAAGVASQYVRGDGVLASFPDVSGGGGGQVYYFNGNQSQPPIAGNPYKQLSVVAAFGPNSDFTSGTVNNVAFVNFITDVGKPTQEIIPGGVWIFQCYLSSTSATAGVYATVEVYDGTTFLVQGTSLTETITNGATIDLYTFTVAIPTYDPLLAADRIAIRFYPTNLGGINTITLHTEGPHLSSVQTTFSTGIASIDGLTAAAQYLQVGTTGADFNITTSSVDTHVFNLPTASASNRGALSSGDWTTFNGKQDTISLTTAGSSGSSTFITNTLNVPTYTLSCLGGVPTSRQLTINGTAFDLSADRSWSVGTVTSVSALTLGTTGTDLSSTVATSTTTPVITLNVPTASATNRGALSSTDWSTFDSKIGGSGTLSYVPRFTASGTIGNSLIQDNSSTVGIGGLLATSQFYITQNALAYGIYSTNGNAAAVTTYGGSFRTTAIKAASNVGIEGVATGSTGLNTAVSGSANGSGTAKNYGGSFIAGNGTANYSLRLLDGTQGSGKFLKDVTGSGEANWANITTSDIAGILTGSGTADYLTKFSASTILANSVIQDNGTTLGIGNIPAGDKKLSITTGVIDYGILVIGGDISSITGSGTTTGVTGLGTTGVVGSGTSAIIAIGGSFTASGAGSKYSVQLQDGTETVAGRFLKNITTDGKANWANITVADTGLTLTTNFTSGPATLVGNTLNIPQYSGGGGSVTLSQVLINGNSAGTTDINMNNNDITSIATLSANNGPAVQMINITSAVNMVLMYNT